MSLISRPSDPVSVSAMLNYSSTYVSWHFHVAGLEANAASNFKMGPAKPTLISAYMSCLLRNLHKGTGFSNSTSSLGVRIMTHIYLK